MRRSMSSGQVLRKHLSGKVATEQNLGRQRGRPTQRFLRKGPTSSSRNQPNEASTLSAKWESHTNWVWRGEPGPGHAAFRLDCKSLGGFNQRIQSY